MLNLVSLEKRRLSLAPYRSAAFIITAVLLGLLYLLVLMPKWEPDIASDPDIVELLTYRGLSWISVLLIMACFLILSSVLYAKLLVTEYCGSRASLLFSYPVSRTKILWAKIALVLLFTTTSMFLSGAAVLGVFCLTGQLFPLYPDILAMDTLLDSVFSLLCYSLITGAWGIVALWFGFRKKSAFSTIVAGVVISVLLCQVMSLSRNSHMLMLLFLLSGIAAAAIALRSLSRNISGMEVLT